MHERELLKCTRILIPDLLNMQQIPRSFVKYWNFASRKKPYLKHTALIYELRRIQTKFFGSTTKSFNSFFFLLTKTVKNRRGQIFPVGVRWPCGLRRSPAAAWFQWSRVRIPLRTLVLSLVFVLCCVDNSLCDEMVSCLEESYRECVSKYVW